MTKPRTTLALVAWYAVASGALVWYSVQKPHHNWDMILYAACAKNLVIDDMETLHAFTYGELKHSVPEATLAALTEGPYRKTVSEDVEAFAQQLPLYQIRVLYNVAVLLLSALGANIFAATHVVSALGVVAGLWLMLVTFRPLVSPFLLGLLPLVGIVFGLLDVAKYSTPDGLAFATVCLATWLLVRNRVAMLVILPLGVLVRTDLIVFAALVCVYVFLVRERWRVWAVASMVASVVAYVGVNAYYGNYGLATTYHMTFVEALAYPAQTGVHFGVREYVEALKTGVGEAVTQAAFLLFAGACGAAGYLTWKRRPAGGLRRSEPMRFVFASSVLYVSVHFVVFPEIEERLFLGQYLLVLVVLFSLLRSTAERIRNPDVAGTGAGDSGILDRSLHDFHLRGDDS